MSVCISVVTILPALITVALRQDLTRVRDNAIVDLFGMYFDCQLRVGGL